MKHLFTDLNTPYLNTDLNTSFSKEKTLILKINKAK